MDISRCLKQYLLFSFLENFINEEESLSLNSLIFLIDEPITEENYNDSEKLLEFLSQKILKTKENTTFDFNSAMSGGAIRNCSATGSGGAVYAAPNAAATITGGTITGNTAASGAGFYLSESSTMNLSGNPYFGGTGLVGDALVTTYQNGEAAGNFITQGYTAEENEKNGGKNYTDIRQDIYIAGYVDTDPAASLNVTGRISSGEGTIWVWADSVNHYEMLKQFAVFSGGGISLSDPNKESSMKAFRNAQPDSLTNCGGDYLTGQKGEQANWIYCPVRHLRSIQTKRAQRLLR